ncbi:MAG: SDR family oxidoreductase [Bacteroidetes bacterium]|nr:SDR family oxidoreductase [Bacteroidota bacterium]
MTNHTCIVTGATRGIGKAIAIKFASEGFDVAYCGRNPAAVEALAHLLKAEYGVKSRGWVCDVTDKAQLSRFASEALGFLGGCTVLVHNAGVFLPGAIGDESEGTFETLMSTNVASAYHLTRLCLPELKKTKRAHIFTMCSIASLQAYAAGGSYTISKFALLGLTKVLRQDLIPHGIGVTAVLPGATLTESWAGTEHPETRFIRSRDVAAAVWCAWEMNEHAVMEEVLIRPAEGDI